MSEKLRELGQKIQDKLNNEQSRRRWQAIIGVTFMVVFVVTSIVANKTVFAVNQAAGNYGYYGNYGYGYSGSSTSSDAIPAAPTGLSAGTPTQTAATLTWTAPTLTTTGTAIATGSGSIASYNIAYQTSSAPSSCTSGSHTTTSTTNSKTLPTTLTAGTTYHVAICAVDNNDNTSADSAAFSFATASAGGGGGPSGGGSALSIFSVTTPTVVVTPSATVVLGNVDTYLALKTRNAAAEAIAKTTFITPVLGTVSADVSTKLIAYIKYGYGVSSGASARGEREVAGVINDLKDVVGADKVKESVTNDKFFAVADAMLKGEGIKTTKAVRDIDYAAAFGLEKKLLPAFWALTGIKASEIVAAKGTQKYEDFWEGFSKAVYAVRIPRDLVMERKAIKFVQQRMAVVNRELVKQKVAPINTKSSKFWNFVRAVIKIDQTGVKNII